MATSFSEFGISVIFGYNIFSAVHGRASDLTRIILDHDLSRMVEPCSTFKLYLYSYLDE